MKRTIGDDFVDHSPKHEAWGHEFEEDCDGIRLHYVRRGTGTTALLQHGRPGALRGKAVIAIATIRNAVSRGSRDDKSRI